MVLLKSSPFYFESAYYALQIQTRHYKLAADYDIKLHWFEYQSNIHHDNIIFIKISYYALFYWQISLFLMY